MEIVMLFHFISKSKKCEGEPRTVSIMWQGTADKDNFDLEMELIIAMK
ncbi:hypothetical protein SAMN05421863_10524 [Nitrosomonas communis]|uniref:Uncharacterized protein n=1 Tax=Nitrosomonas communis TaxID=44574 RepID=A0A1I4TL16_9PROT|nr:hypothetical protein SAMN05421863_10524 [Nitrosomonas communis]